MNRYATNSEILDGCVRVCDDERESTEDIDDGHAEGTPLPPTELNGADGGEPEMPMPGIKASDAFDTSWDPPQHEGEPDMPSQEHNEEESTPSRMLCCDKCGSPVSLFRFRYHCGRCGPTTCTVSESQLGEERVWFTGHPPRQVVTIMAPA